MAETVVGDIVYNLDVNTKKFVDGMQTADKNLEKMGESMDKTDQKAQQLGGGLTKLAAAIGGLVLIDKLRDLQKLSEEFTVLAARINRVSADSAEGAENYQRLLAISSKSGADLGTAVKTWESLTLSLREFGKTNDEILGVTDSIMKMGAIGGSSTEEMKNGLRQLGQSFSGGIVRAEEFNSVLENVPEIARQIAKGIGIPFSELRQMMLDGKLTAEVVLEALKKQAAEVDAEFAKMPRTVAQASNAMTNNFGTMISKLDQTSGASASLAKAIDMVAGAFLSLSGDANAIQTIFDGITMAGASLAAILAGRLLTALYGATTAKVAMMRATIANTAAQRVAAAEALKTATAEFAAARAEQQRAAAVLAATSSVVQGSAARAAAADAMAAANARAVMAEKGLQAAMTASAAVAKTTSIAMRGLQTVMGFLGGPVGVILLAATALYQFATSAREAKDPTDLLTQSVDALGNAQLRLQKIKLTEAIAEQDKLAKGSMWTQYKVNALKKDIAEAPEGSNAWKGYTKQLTEIEAESEGAREMSAKLQEQLAKVNAEIDKRSGEKQTVNTPKRKEDPEDAKVRQRLEDELELAKLSGEAKARQAALQKLSANATDEERQKVSDLAAEVWKLDEAKKATTKTDKEGAALAKKKTAEEKKGAEENKQAIIDYAIEIGKLADKTQDYSEASALAKLNKFATPEDVRVMKELAAAQAQIIKAEKDKALLGQLDPMAGEDQRFTKQLEDLKKLNEAKLLEDERYLELKGIAERQHLETVRQLQEENFKAASLGNEILMNSIDAMASGATGALSGILSGTMSLQDALGNLANTVLNSVIGAFVQAGVDFVKQEIIKRAAIQATQTTQQASMAAVAATQAGTTAAMAATTTTTAATTGTAVASSMAPAAGLSSIASFGGAAVIGGAALLATMALAKSFGGGRRYGGDVNSDSFYRINESGPEIFTANDGKQYMTGANGTVTSNADAFGSGGGSRPVQVIIEDYRGNGADPQVSQETLTDRDVIRIVLNDMQSGGQLARATNQITGTKRPGG